MGSNPSKAKGGLKDDGPPAKSGGGGGGGGGGDSAKAAPPSKKAEKKVAKAEAKTAKKFAAVEKKVQKKDRTKVDSDVSDDDSDGGGAYDSDLDRELEMDADIISKQEPEDDHKRLTIQDKARSEAMTWTTNVLPPSDFVPIENGEFRPEESCGLDFVHGFHGWDCLNNLKYTVTEEIVYFAAGLGIVYDPKSGRQKHYHGPISVRGSPHSPPPIPYPPPPLPHLFPTPPDVA